LAHTDGPIKLSTEIYQRAFKLTTFVENLNVGTLNTYKFYPDQTTHGRINTLKLMLQKLIAYITMNLLPKIFIGTQDIDVAGFAED
jgi:hypothetical protein